MLRTFPCVITARTKSGLSAGLTPFLKFAPSQVLQYIQDGFYLDAFTDRLRIQVRTTTYGATCCHPSLLLLRHSRPQQTQVSLLDAPAEVLAFLPTQTFSYNAAIKKFALTSIVLRFQPAGGIQAQTLINVIDMELYDDYSGRVRMVLEIIFVVFVRSHSCYAPCRVLAHLVSAAFASLSR